MNFGTNIHGELYALVLRIALFNKIVYFLLHYIPFHWLWLGKHVA